MGTFESEYNLVMKNGGYKRLRKAVYRLSGDVRKLLSGITSNTLDDPTNALLDRFGKLVVLFDQLVYEKEAYIVFEEKFEKRFLEHMERYVKLSRCTIQKTDLKVFHVIGKELECMKIPQKTGYLLISNNDPLITEISDYVYNTIRMENGISIQGIDFDDEMFLNTNWKEVVSYSKGCFVGQEVMSRIKAYGKPPKKLVLIAYEKLPDSVTSAGKDAGKITSSCYSPRHKKHLAFSMIPFGISSVDGGVIVQG